MSSAECLLAMLDFEFNEMLNYGNHIRRGHPPFYTRPVGVDSDVATSSL